MNKQLIDRHICRAIAIALTDAEILRSRQEVEHLLVVEVGSTSTFRRCKRNHSLGLIDIDFHTLSLVNRNRHEFPFAHLERVALRRWIIDGEGIHTIGEAQISITRERQVVLRSGVCRIAIDE